jgi:hypothetical protein
MSFFQQFPKTPFDFKSNGVVTQITDIFRFVKADAIFLDDLATYQYFNVPNGDRPDIVSSMLYDTPQYYWTFFIINEHLKTGLSGWPMSPTELDDYFNLEYNGVVIDTEPVVVRGSDGQVVEYRNSLADRFDIGETLTGSVSGASGMLKEKKLEMSQLILTNVTGNFRPLEFISGSETQDVVTSAQVYNWREAPHHYEDSAGNPAYASRFINESDTSGGVKPESSMINLTPVSYLDYEISLNDERSRIRVVRPNMISRFAERYRELINA